MSLNFDDAILAHSRWKKRLADLIEGSSTELLDPDKVGRDDQCDLGKWIRAAPPEVQVDPEFVKLVAEHAEFHRQAASILRFVLKGDLTNAKKGLEPSSDYLRRSVNVINQIGKIRSRIK